MEHQLEIDLPKPDDGPSASIPAKEDADAPAEGSRRASRRASELQAEDLKRPDNAHLVIGDDHGRVRVIKLPLAKAVMKPTPARTKMHPYAGDVDISTAVLKKSEKDRHEKKHLHYEEVKEVEPKVVLEWEAHPHSAVTHME